MSGLSPEELAVLDKRLPVERINTLTLPRLFIGLSAQSGAEIRGLREGRIVQTDCAPVNIRVDLFDVHDFEDSQNVAAALLWEFPVGTELESMLPLFQRGMYAYLFYRIPQSPIQLDQINTFFPFATREMRDLYFDENGVVQGHRKYVWVDGNLEPTEPLSGSAKGTLVQDCTVQEALLRKALRVLRPGDTLDKLNARLRHPDALCRSDTRINAFDIRRDVFGDDLDRIVGTIRTPSFSRLPENPSKSAFDFVTVEVTLIKSFYGKEVLQRLRPHLPVLNQRVLNKVRLSAKLAQRPLLANLLKIDRIEVQPDWTLLYTIGFKDGVEAALRETTG